MLRNWLGAGISLAVFALLAITMQKEKPTAFDNAAGDWIRAWRGDGLTPVFQALSALVSTTAFIVFLAGFAVLFLLAYRRWQEPLGLLICLAIAFGLNRGLKELFERARPDVEALIEASGYSFPSGHALMSSAFYGLLAYLLYRQWRKSYRGWAWAAAAAGFVLVLAIGASRVYLGVHYPSDILAGYAIGTALLVIMAAVLGRRKR